MPKLLMFYKNGIFGKNAGPQNVKSINGIKCKKMSFIGGSFVHLTGEEATERPNKIQQLDLDPDG